jgi:Ca2+-binding RTX toxin-like protein
MSNHKRPERSRAVWTTRLAVAAVAAAAVAGAAGIAADHANASPYRHAHTAMHRFYEPKFKRPKLRHGLLSIEGTTAADKITLRLKAGDPGTLQVDVGDNGSADFEFARARVTAIVVDTGAGDDLVRIDESNGTFTDSIPTTLDGGPGDDTLSGGSGAERLVGGDGNDTVTGGKGNDLAFMGAGDDAFVWNPGDGSDTVEGQDGSDTMLFNGANVAERVDLSANGNRLRFFRDVANITMDTAGVEQVDFNALGGADLVTVHDLSGTDVKQVNVDESNPAGSGTGDGQPDQVIVEGTAAADKIDVNSDANNVTASGLSAQISVEHPETTDELAVNGLGGNDQITVNGSNADDKIDVSGDATGVAISGLPAHLAIQKPEAGDQLTVNGLAGNDSISAAGLAAQTIGLTLDGGPGDDTLVGSQGVETLVGGDGNDTIAGGKGNDLAFMGAGDDAFVWNPGDGSDTVEGQDGSDTMLFNGANVAERVDLSANGNRLRFFRDVANITMDTAGVEQVDFNALGGADQVTVHDLTGTDVERVNIDESNPAGSGSGDGQPDQVIVEGTNSDDTITAVGSNGATRVGGLPETVTISGAEPANDTLTINALDGNDHVDASKLAASASKLTIDGGNGNDVLIGGEGDDVLTGGAGDDLLIGGPGQDTLDGGTGNNTLIQ